MTGPAAPLGTAVENDTAVPMDVAISNALFAEAITATERRPLVALRADFSRDGFNHPLADLTRVAGTVSVQREVSNSQLPAEVGLVDGVAVAQLTATLRGRWPDRAGTDLSPAQAFSPYRQDSPLYTAPVLQSPVTFDTGFVTARGPKTTRQFTGYVKKVAPTSGARSTVLQALDPGNRLRQPITLPGNGLDSLINRARGGDSYRSRYNSQWLIDHILRRNGIYASPPARPDAILSVTGHGSTIPEVGWGGAPEIWGAYRGPTWVRDGPFNMLCAFDNNGLGVAGGRWWLDSPITAAPGTGIGFSGWFKMLRNPASQQNDIIYTQISDTVVLRWGFNESGFPYVVVLVNNVPADFYHPVTLPANGAPIWAFIGCHVAFSTSSVTVTFRSHFDGAISGTTTVQTKPLAARTSLYYVSPYLIYRTYRAFTNLQLWSNPAAPGDGGWVGETWISQADIDEGANELTAVPELIEVDSLTLLQEVVAAEFGAFGFNEDGRAWFRSRLRTSDPDEPVTETMHAQRSLEDMATTADESSIRNSISLITTPTFVQDWAYLIKATANDEFDLAPNASTMFLIGLPAGTYATPRDGAISFSTAPYVAKDDWGKRDQYRYESNKMLLRYCAVHRDITDTPHPSTGISFACRRISPFALLLIGTNTNDHWIRFQTPTTYSNTGQVQQGQPALELPVRIVDTEPTVVTRYADQASIDRWGFSAYDMGGANRWRQWPTAIGTVAQDVLATTANPVPVLDTVRVPHDPRRKLFARVTIADPQGLGSVDARIAGITTTIDLDAGGGGAAMDDVVARPLRSPGL